MSPERTKAWIRVVRDALLIAIGTMFFLTVLVLYVLRREPPNITLLGVATACFGIGVVLRADELIVRGNGNGNGNGKAKNGGA